MGWRHGAHAAQVGVAAGQRLRRGVAVAVTATAGTIATDQGLAVAGWRGRGADGTTATSAAASTSATLRGAGELQGPGAT